MSLEQKEAQAWASSECLTHCEYSQKANMKKGSQSGSIIDQLDSNAVRQTQLSLRQRRKQVGCYLSERQKSILPHDSCALCEALLCSRPPLCCWETEASCMLLLQKRTGE